MEMENMTVNNELAVENFNDIAPASEIENFKKGSSAYYCSLIPKTREEKIIAYNAINNTNEMISKNQKEIFSVVDIAAFPVKVTNTKTGEIIDAMSCVLICDDGKCYRATSVGIATSLQKIFAIFGLPDGGAWHNEPIKMKAVEKLTRSGYTTIVLELIQ